MKRDNPDDYRKFWEMFGLVLKEGIISDGRDKEQILKLCLFDSSRGGQTTIEDYRANMKDAQKQIYYLAGASAETMALSPKLEAFRKRDIEVLLLGDPVDEIWAGSGQRSDECPFVSISAEDVEIPGDETEQERARQRMMQAVPTADVVIRNPTHIAIAIRYDREKDRAPVVVAKGVDSLALRIVAAAEASGVYVTENKPLARAIYDAVPLDAEVPEKFYRALAEVLAYVYSLRKKDTD